MTRRRRRWLLGAGVAAAAWAIAVAVVSLLARGDLVAGREAVRSARHRPVDQVLEGPAAGDLERARAHFTRARQFLGSPLLLPLRIVPLAERQVRAARALAGAGARTSTIALGAARSAQAALQAPHGPGPDRIALVRRLGALASQTQQALGGVSLGPQGLLLPPIAAAHRELHDELVQVRVGLARGAFAASAAADLLSGPRRYVLFAANNAEMRAGSGMFLSVGELDTADGRIRLSHMTTVIDVAVPPGAVPVGDDLQARWGWLEPNVDWRNLMVSPRFDANAALAAQMWQASGHGPADGVIALDPVALQAILRGIGPVTVGDRTVDADHVVPELLHDQYVRFPQLEERPERREELSAFAGAAMDVLDAGHWSPARLGEELGAAIRGRHIMVWSTQPSDQQAWLGAGAGGTLQGNSVMAAVLNRGGNKLDQYLSARADMRLRRSGGHTDATITLRLRNDAPLNEIPYIIGPHFGTGLRPGDYLGIVAFTLPGSATDGRLDGADALAVAGPDGPTRVIGSEVLIPAGTTRTLVVHFRLGPSHRTLRVEPSARVPATEWRFGDRTWRDTDGKAVVW
jgi:hypothetical protein